MVLDLIAIGVGIYLLAKHKKTKRERAAAYAAGQPIYNPDGSVTYPPGYSGCPTHGQTGAVGARGPPQPQGYYDEKRQVGVNVNEASGLPAYRDQPTTQQQQQNGAEEVPRYSMDGKKGAEAEVREVGNEKEDYVRV